MSEAIENKLNKIPVVKQLVSIGKKIKPQSFEGLSLYDILELYIIGIFKGAFSYRASAVAFSFFIINHRCLIPITDFFFKNGNHFDGPIKIILRRYSISVIKINYL